MRETSDQGRKKVDSNNSACVWMHCSRTGGRQRAHNRWKLHCEKIMHKSFTFMYIKTCKRIIFIMLAFLVYISMYLIHNAYGTSLVIIKPSESGGSAPSQLLDNSNVNVNDYSSRSSGGNVEVSVAYRVSIVVDFFSPQLRSVLIQYQWWKKGSILKPAERNLFAWSPREL